MKKRVLFQKQIMAISLWDLITLTVSNFFHSRLLRTQRWDTGIVVMLHYIVSNGFLSGKREMLKKWHSTLQESHSSNLEIWESVKCIVQHVYTRDKPLCALCIVLNWLCVILCYTVYALWGLWAAELHVFIIPDIWLTARPRVPLWASMM